MESKTKAEELIEKFKPHADWNNEYGSQEVQANVKHAKQCALIAVDEILKIMNEEYLSGASKITYWQEVKSHIKTK